MVPRETIKTSDFIKHVSKQISREGINFSEFLEVIGDRGVLLATIILIAPFLLPVSIPGSSLPFGLAIILLNLRNFLGGRVLLPGFILEYKISHKNMIRILNGVKGISSKLERFSKPRFMFISDQCTMRILNSFLIILSAFLLMLPLPVPLTDFLPACNILLLTWGSLEDDGFIILIGYILTAITTGYFIAVAFVGFGILKYLLFYFNHNYLQHV